MQSSEIAPFDSLEEGIEFRFRGIERDADGEPVGEMIDVVLIVPPLNLDTLKRTQPLIARIGTTTPGEALSDICEVTARALSQNYRRVPRWLIEQSVNVANMHDLFTTLMDVSGMKRKAADEKKAQAMGLPSTGTASTPT